MTEIQLELVISIMNLDLLCDGYHWSVQITRFSICTVRDAQQFVCLCRIAIPQVDNEGTLYTCKNKTLCEN